MPKNYHEELSWIGCSNDACGKWFHQFCVKISDEDYVNFTNNDQEWFCDQCK